MIDIAPAAPNPLSAHLRNVYSQFGEDGLLAEIFRRIGTTNKQCFECGAADGVWFSNTRSLIDAGWSAVLIEADEKNWPQLDKLDAPPRVNVVHGKLQPKGPASLDAILAQVGFDATPDLGVLDVDGQEYHLWNWLMRYQPRVMVVEYDNTALENPNFVPEIGGEGQAGLAALCSVAVSKGYFNVFTTKTNAIFVLNSEREKFYAADAGSLEAEDKGGGVIFCPQCGSDRILVARNTRSTGSCSDCGFSQDDAYRTFPKERRKPAPDPTPVIATPKATEVKVIAILSRPRFGLNCFWDCAGEALSPWHIPVQSFYTAFWGQGMEKGFEENIAAGVDWILTLDYDSLFTSKHVQQLIDALTNHPEIDAIAALQVRRGRPLPLLVRSDGQVPITGGPVQVDTAHFGLTLFRTSAIKRMKKPWFWSKPTEAGDWGEGRLDDDIFFWGNFRDNAGAKLFVHTGCRIGHVEEMVAHYDDKGEVQHSYITAWRNANGHTIRSME